MDTRHPRRLLAPEQVLMRFSIIYDRPSSSYKVSQRYHDDEHLLSEPHRSQAYASTRPD